MKKIILMDMDGTITPARKPIEQAMIDKLNDVLNKGISIAIVSGSTYGYILEQLSSWSRIEDPNVWVMPCNGTQCYHQGEEIYSLNMREAVSEEDWKSLMQLLFLGMSTVCIEEFPITGDHVSYRGSTINYCPVGRNANDAERQAFKEWDTKTNYRAKFADDMTKSPLGAIFKFKVGGNTSVDIYPIGWDKSYAFRHFEGFDEIYFIGDRCEPMGNDYEGYIKAGQFGKITHGPDQTIHILSEILEGSIS